jgi:hypothetical protein
MKKVPTLCEACQRVTLPFDRTCTSFPERIPSDIWVRGFDHRVSLAGEAPFELDPARRPLYDEWLAYSEPYVRDIAARLD